MANNHLTNLTMPLNHSRLDSQSPGTPEGIGSSLLDIKQFTEPKNDKKPSYGEENFRPSITEEASCIQAVKDCLTPKAMKLKPLEPNMRQILRDEKRKNLNSLKYHSEKYQKAKERIDQEFSNIDEIANIRAEYSSKKMEIVKYNYMMDEAVQNFPCYDGYIQLKEGGRFL